MEIISVFHSVADPDPGSGALLTPGSGIQIGKKIRIRDAQPGSYFRELRNNFLGFIYLNSLLRIRDVKNSDPGWKKSNPGSEKEKIRIRDGKNSDPGSVINIPDPQHWFSITKVGAGTGSAPCRFL